MVNIESFINIFDAFKVMKSSIKKPFSKRQMKYWAETDAIVRQKYGVRLVDYLERGLREGKPIIYLASEIGTNLQRLYKFAKNLEIQVKNRYNQKEVKRKLQDIEDIIELDIKDGLCLSYRKLTGWRAIEKKVKQKYKAPSLPAYLLYEHQFNNQHILALSIRLGVNYISLKRAMVMLGIPLIDYRRKCKDNAPINRKYLIKKYWEEGLTQKQIAKEKGITGQGISRWMKVLNIPRRTQSKLIERLSKCLSN